MTTGPGTPTLDQLQVLIHVVEAGSFTAAAARTNRALSVISYTIANLEAQLGVDLFDRGARVCPAAIEAELQSKPLDSLTNLSWRVSATA